MVLQPTLVLGALLLARQCFVHWRRPTHQHQVVITGWVYVLRGHLPCDIPYSALPTVPFTLANLIYCVVHLHRQH